MNREEKRRIMRSTRASLMMFSYKINELTL